MSHAVRLFLQGIDSAELIWMLERQTPGMQEGWCGDLHFVSDESYDVAILLNEALPVRTPPERTICLLMEPPEKHRPQPHPSIGTILSFNPADRSRFGDGFIHHPMLSFLHAEVLHGDTPGPHEKPRPLSMVVSRKLDLPWMRHRVALVDALLRTDLPIDVYGRDFHPAASDPRIKGPLPRIDKTQALRDYTYSIACECSPQDGYLTEKFLDCVVNNCIPITNSPTAAAHFPPGSFVAIDVERPIADTVDQIAHLITHARRPDPEPLRRAKQQVLTGSWSLAGTIARIIAERVDHLGTPDRMGRPTAGAICSPPPVILGKATLPATHAPNISDSHRSITIALWSPDATTPAGDAALRSHCVQREPSLSVRWISSYDAMAPSAGSPPLDDPCDLTYLLRSPQGPGAVINRMMSSVRTPYILLLPPGFGFLPDCARPFLDEAIRLMEADDRLALVALDQDPQRHLDDRRCFDGPFGREDSGITLFIQNPQRLEAGFLNRPAVVRVSAFRDLGPCQEDAEPGRLADTSYRDRFCARFVMGVSPELMVFNRLVSNKRSKSPPLSAPGRRFPSMIPAPARVAWIIPYRRDSEERAENLRLVREHLASCMTARGWDGEILLTEQPADGTPFWKARLINDAARRTTAPIIAVIDADALVPCRQLTAAIAALSGSCDLCYPYQGAFLNVDRALIPRLGSDPDLMSLASETSLINLNPGSFGAAVLIKRSVFWGAGGMNEHFVSWGREDVEIHERVTRLGYTCQRIDGAVYHLDHPRTIDSRPDQPHHAENCAEFDRITALDRYALMDDVATWEWTHA